MTVLLLIMGILTASVGLSIARKPEPVCGFLRRHTDSVTLHALNIIVRVFFGYLLLQLTDISRFSLLTNTIGWTCLGIALLLTVTGRERFKKGFSWAISLMENNNRIAGFLITLFGLFLICSFI